MTWTKWALVTRGTIGSAHHSIGLPSEIASDSVPEDMASARLLLLDESSPQVGPALLKAAQDAGVGSNLRTPTKKKGILLYRFSERATFAGDTWHEDFEAANRQVQWEYGQEMVWREVPAWVEDATLDRFIQETLAAANREEGRT